jgi:hypothetical protein
MLLQSNFSNTLNYKHFKFEKRCSNIEKNKKYCGEQNKKVAIPEAA